MPEHVLYAKSIFQIKTEDSKHVLLIPKVMMADAGIFTCRASNPAGVAECSAELCVEGKWWMVPKHLLKRNDIC